jgi:hypothetical protein
MGNALFCDRKLTKQASAELAYSQSLFETITQLLI